MSGLVDAPTEWRRLPIGRLFRRREIRGRSDLPLLSVYRDWGVVQRAGREDNYNKPGEDLDTYKHVQHGDLVLNKMKTWQGSLGVSPHEGIVSPAYFVAEPVAPVESRFIHHLLRSQPLIAEYGARSKGIRPSQWDLPWEEFSRIIVALPSERGQRAIADFLDAETSRIDALIAKKRQLVERLNQRLSVEHERLVLGQDQVQGNSTNGGFYGATAWPETALRHLNCEVQTGPFGSQLHADDYVKDGWPVVNPSNIVGGQIIALPEVSVNNKTRARLARHLLRSGDVVFGRRGEMGRAGLVHEHEAGWLCGTGSLRLRLVGDQLLPEYLKLLLETGAAKRYFQLSSVGSTMENLNTEILLALPVLVPPIGEQSRVVSVVSKSRAYNLKLESKLNRSIDLLAEHRQALITAAVMGQIEVPVAAAR